MEKLFKNLGTSATKNPLGTAVGVLIIIVVLYFFGSKIIGGLRDVFFVPDQINPNKGKGKTHSLNQKKTLSDQDAEILADELYDVMDGIFTGGATKERVFKKVNELNDQDLIKVYNTFNRKYENTKGLLDDIFGGNNGNLIDWIKSEKNRAKGGDWISSHSDELIKRLERIKD